MATVVDFPNKHKLEAQWAVMFASVRRAAEAYELDEKRAELLVGAMKTDWNDFFASATAYPLPRRDLPGLSVDLTEQDRAALHAFACAKAQDASDMTWLHFLGLFHVLLLERANALALGGQLRGSTL